MGVCLRFRDFWNKKVTAGAIYSCSSLSILGVSSSGPLALFGFRSLSSFVTPLSVIFMSFIVLYLLPPTSGIIFSESSVKTD